MFVGDVAGETRVLQFRSRVLRRGAYYLHLNQQVLRAEGLKKVFRSGASELVLFENLSFEVNRGEMLAIVGASGAGKSTLLHIVGALDRPSAGDVYCAHLRLSTLSEDAAADFRNRDVGFVWQFHYLLPEFTAMENVAMPLLTRGTPKTEAEREAMRWLGEVGLAQRSHHRAGELSGGEQQRAALARALITEPKILLADEPTGDLDSRTADSVFELISRLHREHQLSSLIATHNFGFARRCHRVLRLENGRMEEVVPETLAD
jgi:lipoprotein-releasing system ATP-binding protein